MAEKKEKATYFSLRKEIESGKFQPIYILHGEEPYYIDKLSELIVERALSEDERDFNLTVYYGSDADVHNVIGTCKQYPVFSQYRVVILREAQLVSKQSGSHSKDLDLFKLYAEKPLRSTILVVCNKGDTIKSRPFTDAIGKNHTGVLFESPRVKNERDLQSLISSYATSTGCNIDAKSVKMLSDFIGNDLSRMFGELDKLKLLVGEDNRITPELIERNIGISKEFNNFELQDALAVRNAERAYRIIDYFEKNPKTNPVVVTVSSLFSYFSTMLLLRASKDKSESGLMSATGIKSRYYLEKIKAASSRYSTQSCVNIIGYLRECDVRSKGMGSRQDSYALLRELIYKILHS